MGMSKWIVVTYEGESLCKDEAAIIAQFFAEDNLLLLSRATLEKIECFVDVTSGRKLDLRFLHDPQWE